MVLFRPVVCTLYVFIAFWVLIITELAISVRRPNSGQGMASICESRSQATSLERMNVERRTIYEVFILDTTDDLEYEILLLYILPYSE